jgi:hypothetical protein
VTAGSDVSGVPWEVWIYADVGKGLEVAFTDEFQSGNYGFAPVPTLNAEDMDRYAGLQMIQALTELAPATRLASLASTEPEQYTLSSLVPLNFYYESLCFRGPEGKTDVQINLAIPIDNVALPADADTTVIVERRVALLDDRMDETSLAKESLAIPVSDRRRGRSLMATDRVDLAVRSGTYELAVQAWRLGTDLLQVYRQSIEVPDFTGDRLMLSDLQIAQRITESVAGGDSTFVRGRWSILPAPSRLFYPGDSQFVYFEIYNLARDEFGATRFEVAYEVRLTEPGGAKAIPFIPRIRRRTGEAVEVRFEQIGTESTVSDYVQLDLGRVEKGRYVLQMNVTDLVSGETASREGVFKIGRRPE